MKEQEKQMINQYNLLEQEKQKLASNILKLQGAIMMAEDLLKNKEEDKNG